ncbi:glycine betaine/L-proline ABC transporter substrate-binding protein ProX [Roseofilum sp. BLCC_M91]|uniref:Glycine betaine/L-proline ABC transporter substrate-binding protein ProX n=1 Tax=Roseofilum halophilum BLCC-M91 TaxID=3022259 RepID=A0ABT7BTA4_9CYAN|nr:glycine betaine/L-proline ABC transporter substrate-binding protein ProX [Roseofilum halophilum]MDJ1181538.1 glycine betaine/L-proline ABC transporter substrate-binding protein ProX [Roseofilum halophilum BLCC-M91]
MLVGLLTTLMSCQTSPESRETTSLEAVTIRAAHSGFVEESFQTEVVNLGLEQLGYNIDTVKELDYSVIYVSLANSDLDYTVIYYNPAHKDFFENAGGSEKLQISGLVIPEGSQGYRIDKKTADQYAITNIAQLKDPELAQLFDSDGDGKANLAGCNIGWSCESMIDHHIQAYELEDTVEQDRGNFTALLANMIARYQEGKPIVFYAYNPHWIFAVLQTDREAVWLEVPFTSLPGEMSNLTAEETTFNGKNLGFPGSKQNIVINKTFAESHPIAKRWFELVQIPLADMDKISLRIKDGENTPEDIRRLAEEWVSENQEQFDGWLAEAKAAVE